MKQALIIFLPVTEVCYPTLVYSNWMTSLIRCTELEIILIQSLLCFAAGEWRQLPLIIPCIHSSKVFVVFLSGEEHVFPVIRGICLWEKEK